MIYRTLAPLALACVGMVAAESVQAIDVHLDSTLVTIQVPTSGFVWADFTGTMDLTPGYEFLSFAYSIAYTAGGSATGFHLLDPFATLNRLPGVLFSFQISASDLPDLYAYSSQGNALNASFAECPIGVSGTCNNAFFTYALELLPAAGDPNEVPEPPVLGLVGAALAGLGLMRRKTQSRRQGG